MGWRSGVLAAPRGISLALRKAAPRALAAPRRGGFCGLRYGGKIWMI